MTGSPRYTKYSRLLTCVESGTYTEQEDDDEDDDGCDDDEEAEDEEQEDSGSENDAMYDEDELAERKANRKAKEEGWKNF